MCASYVSYVTFFVSPEPVFPEPESACRPPAQKTLPDPATLLPPPATTNAVSMLAMHSYHRVCTLSLSSPPTLFSPRLHLLPFLRPSSSRWRWPRTKPSVPPLRRPAAPPPPCRISFSHRRAHDGDASSGREGAQGVNRRAAGVGGTARVPAQRGHHRPKVLQQGVARLRHQEARRPPLTGTNDLLFFSLLFSILSPSPSWDFDDPMRSPGRWLNGVH
jgi:hypothetical protein